MTTQGDAEYSSVFTSEAVTSVALTSESSKTAATSAELTTLLSTTISVITTTSTHITMSVSQSASQAMTSRTTVQVLSKGDNADLESNITGMSWQFYLIAAVGILLLMIVAGCMVVIFQAALKSKCKRRRRKPAEPETEMLDVMSLYERSLYPTRRENTTPVQRPRYAASNGDDEDNGYEQIPANLRSVREKEKSMTASYVCVDNPSGYISMDNAVQTKPNSNSGTERTNTKDPQRNVGLSENDPDNSDDLDFTDNTPTNRRRKPGKVAGAIAVPPIYMNTTTLQRVPLGNNTFPGTKKEVQPQLPPRKPKDQDETNIQQGNGVSTFQLKRQPVPTPYSYNVIHLPDGQGNGTLGRLRAANRDVTIYKENNQGICEDRSISSVHNPQYLSFEPEMLQNSGRIGVNEMSGDVDSARPHSQESLPPLPDFDEMGYLRLSECFDSSAKCRNAEIRQGTNQCETAFSGSVEDHVQGIYQSITECQADELESGATGDSSRASTFEIVLTVHRPKGKRAQLKDYVVR